MSDRYVQVADSDVFMCRDCPVGNRHLLIHQTETHDRWHDRQAIRDEAAQRGRWYGANYGI